jgi:hypothetical protein
MKMVNNPWQKKVTVGTATGDMVDVLREEMRQVSELKQPPLYRYDLNAGYINSQLMTVVDKAIFGVRAGAMIDIVYPTSGSTLSSTDCMRASEEGGAAVVGVVVKLHSFRLPDDGKWCVHVDGREQSCVGDVRYDIDVVLPHCNKGSSIVIQAFLKSGFSDAQVLKQSPVVTLLIN